MAKKKFKSTKDAPDVLKKIDFTTLRGQKTVLIKLADTIRDTKPQPVKIQDSEMVAILVPKETEDVLDGIINLIDALQDYAVDVLGVPEMLVFDFEEEENRESKPVKEEDKTKTLWLCPNCGSDNVEFKVWANANTNEITDGNPMEDEDCYCNDCKKHIKLILSTVKKTK